MCCVGIEMDAAMPLAILANRIEATTGFTHGSESFQGVEIPVFGFKRVTPVLDWAGGAHGFQSLM